MKELPAEMIDAGVRYLHSDPGLSEALLVQGIYEAMSAATGKQQVGEVQGDGRSASEMADALERIAEGALSEYEGVEADELHILRCAKLIRDLAARQPVTVEESDYVDVPDIFESARQPGVLIAQKVGDYRVTVAEDTITVSHGRDIVFAYSAGDAEPVIARQPGAQEEVTDAEVEKAWSRFEAALHASDGDTPEDRVLSQTIDQRDRYHEVADELAAHIERITGVEIGEHSNLNCPWQNAIEAAENYTPAQGITEEECEWLDYAIAHMRDDSEPEDQTCADVLERMLARIDGWRDGGLTPALRMQAASDEEAQWAQSGKP